MRSLILACLLCSVNCQIKDMLSAVGQGVKKEISDVKNPIDQTISGVGSSQCDVVKSILGLTFDQMEAGNEPDLNSLEIKFLSPEYTVTYNITAAAREIPRAAHFNPKQDLIIFLHGFIDDPNLFSFNLIRNAFFSQGDYNVIALDGSSLIRWLYVRSSTYVRFMGQKLGEVLAAMKPSGVKPLSIHIIGHSLGSHIASFAGKTYAELTGEKVGRISGLDPAGPCFSAIDPELRLKASDAVYVDVMHTDAGVFGLWDPVGHSDFYPNRGAQQPNCLLSTCSHNRAWEYYAESVVNPHAFPAAKCSDWEAFKREDCSASSYMGYPSRPGTEGSFFLQTRGESPYSLGEEGTHYKDQGGIVSGITGMLMG